MIFLFNIFRMVTWNNLDRLDWCIVLNLSTETICRRLSACRIGGIFIPVALPRALLSQAAGLFAGYHTGRLFLIKEFWTWNRMMKIRPELIKYYFDERWQKEVWKKDSHPYARDITGLQLALVGGIFSPLALPRALLSQAAGLLIWYRTGWLFLKT